MMRRLLGVYCQTAGGELDVFDVCHARGGKRSPCSTGAYLTVRDEVEVPQATLGVLQLRLPYVVLPGMPI